MWAVWNLLAGSFSFVLYMLPILRQQKFIFYIFEFPLMLYGCHFRGASTGAILLMLCCIMANLQLLSYKHFPLFHLLGVWISTFQIYVIKIIFWDFSCGAIWFMLQFKIADIQRFSDWLISVQLFHQKAGVSFSK